MELVLIDSKKMADGSRGDEFLASRVVGTMEGVCVVGLSAFQMYMEKFEKHAALKFWLHRLCLVFGALYLVHHIDRDCWFGIYGTEASLFLALAQRVTMMAAFATLAAETHNAIRAATMRSPNPSSSTLHPWIALACFVVAEAVSYALQLHSNRGVYGAISDLAVVASGTFLLHISWTSTSHLRTKYLAASRAACVYESQMHDPTSDVKSTHARPQSPRSVSRSRGGVAWTPAARTAGSKAVTDLVSDDLSRPHEATQCSTTESPSRPPAPTRITLNVPGNGVPGAMNSDSDHNRHSVIDEAGTDTVIDHGGTGSWKRAGMRNSTSRVRGSTSRVRGGSTSRVQRGGSPVSGEPRQRRTRRQRNTERAIQKLRSIERLYAVAIVVGVCLFLAVAVTRLVSLDTRLKCTRSGLAHAGVEVMFQAGFLVALGLLFVSWIPWEQRALDRQNKLRRSIVSLYRKREKSSISTTTARSKRKTFYLQQEQVSPQSPHQQPQPRQHGRQGNPLQSPPRASASSPATATTSEDTSGTASSMQVASKPGPQIKKHSNNVLTIRV